MIKSFRHAGLEKFFRTGSKAGMQPKHEVRLGLQLGALDLAICAEDMNVPAWQWHALKGDMKGHFAISVNGNWRLTFFMDGPDAVLVDYRDYH